MWAGVANVVTILESTAQKDGDRGKRTSDWARTRDLHSFTKLQPRAIGPSREFIPQKVQRAMGDEWFATGTDGSWLKLHETLHVTNLHWMFHCWVTCTFTKANISFTETRFVPYSARHHKLPILSYATYKQWQRWILNLEPHSITALCHHCIAVATMCNDVIKNGRHLCITNFNTLRISGTTRTDLKLWLYPLCVQRK